MCERVFVCVWVCVYRKRALFKIRRTARRHIAYIVVVVVAATKKFSIVPSYFFPVHTLHANLKTIAIFICFHVFVFRPTTQFNRSAASCCLNVWWPISFQFPHISHIFFLTLFCFCCFLFSPYVTLIHLDSQRRCWFCIVFSLKLRVWVCLWFPLLCNWILTN